VAVALFNENGAPLALGKELGRGGEGAVFELPGTDLVAKVYHRPAEHLKAEKLAAMVRLRASSLTSIAAWPEQRLLDKTGRQTWGVALPRVKDHREVHHLYSPAHRKVDFPSADWTFLIHVARNCAAAFETIHSAGHVVGDVNQGGILVSRQGTVRLIDCDSFQVSDGLRIFTCDVGVPHFTAPELQGRAFRGLHRTTSHDTFGLSVVLFHLLFMGRHPFAGRYHGPGDMPIELAIQQGLFAYGASAGARQMTPPPHALRLSHVSPEVSNLFERAFRHSGSQVTRPTAREWRVALDDFKKSLTSCSRFAGHKFLNSSSRACPWCEIEKGGGPDLFISITASVKLNSTFDITLLWAQVEAVPSPRPVTILASTTAQGALPTPLPTATLAAGVATMLSGAIAGASGVLMLAGLPQAGVVSLVAFVLWILLRSVSSYSKLRRELRWSLKMATAEETRAEAEWRTKVDEHSLAFIEKKRTLEKLRSDFQSLPQIFRKEEEELQSKKREHQLSAFLRGQYIEDASIKGVGPSRITVLRSFGIETALDVSEARVGAVDGFGPVRTASVVEWRRSVEARFQFDPSKAIDPTERASMQQRHSQKRSTVEAGLRRGLAELQQVRMAADQAWQVHCKHHATAAAQRDRAVVAARALVLPFWAA
jgi:DNA-binding helix-hairpin-helix protein with protein kinase domain